MERSRKRILIVDDFQPWRDFVCLTLKKVPGFEAIAQASDGLDAVQKAKELKPDLILMDIGLPKLNGIEAALQIREFVSNSRILFMSEIRSGDIIDAAMATGAVGYIVKSNAANELLPALQALRCCLAQQRPYLLGTDQKLVYEEIVDAAVSLMHSDFASVQMLFPEHGMGGELRLLAFRGFNPQAARLWEWVNADSKCTCGIALRDFRRVIAPDIASSDLKQAYFQTGILACQTTPLIARSGDVVGMISTHWRKPYEPSDDELRIFDILARGAADVIESSRRDAA